MRKGKKGASAPTEPMVKERVGYSLGVYEFEGDIDSIITRLQEFKEQGATHIEHTYERDYGDSDRYSSFYPYRNRPETAPEKVERENKERLRQAQVDKFEREQYERLRARFEG